MARLARLQLAEPEIMSLQGELNALLGHFSDIANVNVEGMEPLSHPVPIKNVWADDEAGSVLPRENAVRNSALHRAGLFVVPQIIED